MVARARCSALFTAGSLTSSRSATSAARKPSTSLSTRTARCRGGRCWIAATKASAIDSLASYRASGPVPGRASQTSGYGSSHIRRAPPGRLRRHEGRVRHRSAAGGCWPAARSGTGWSRSGTARCAATRAPRTRRDRARRPAGSPAACPRRLAASRGSGSSAPGARPRTGRSARRTPGRLPPSPGPAPYPPRSPVLPPVPTPPAPESHRLPFAARVPAVSEPMNERWSRRLHASLAALEWTVNAYTLSFAAVALVIPGQRGPPGRTTGTDHPRSSQTRR